MKIFGLTSRLPLFTRKLPITQAKNANIGIFPFAKLYLNTNFKMSSQKKFTQDLLIAETKNDLKQNEIRELQVGSQVEDSVLVVKYEGKIYSINSKCSHFGLPLAFGSMIGEKLICPFHNAGFSVKTGEADQGPVFEGLQTFPVQIQGDKIVVKVPKIGWNARPVRKQLGLKNVDSSKKIVIVGFGPTALSAINTLRDTGYKGQIHVFAKDQELPYDRTLLSKYMNENKKPGSIRSSESFKNDGVFFTGGLSVQKIDYQNKKIILSNQKEMSYDKLLLATGCVNRVFPIPGLNEVQYSGLRKISDYQKINQALRQKGVKNVTIIGAGFIGMEVASAIKLQFKDQINVTIIERSPTPLGHIVGKDIGQVLTQIAIESGVNILCNTGIKQIINKNGKPVSVIVDNSEVPTDVLIVSTGVLPVTGYAKELVDTQNNGIKTDVYLQTSEKDVYAAGDIASFPYWYTGKNQRIQHYSEAIYQGSVAALNMAGKKTPMNNIPFFWTWQFNSLLLVTGSIHGWDDIHFDGDLKKRKFAAYYIDSKNDKILGAAVMNNLNHIQIINQAMKHGIIPKASLVKAGKVNFDQILKELRKINPQCTKCKN